MIAEIVMAVTGVFALLVSIASLIVSTNVQTRLNAQEKDLEGKRLFLDLWDKLVQVDRIDPDNPNFYDVKVAVNTLELVALLWDAEIVDRDMISLSFGDIFQMRHTQLEQINQIIPELRADGPSLLRQHPAIGKALPEIIAHGAKRAAVSKAR